MELAETTDKQNTREPGWADSIEKPILIIGLMLMILIINYQTIFRNGISFLLESAGSSGNVLG